MGKASEHENPVGRQAPPREELAEIVESMADGVFVADGQGRIVYLNRKAEQLSGYRLEDLAGRTIESLVPGRLRSRHEQHRARYLKAPAERTMGTELRIRLLRRDGMELPVDVALSPMRSGNGASVVAVVRDVTERADIDSRLSEQAQLLELSHDSVIVRTFEGEITFWNHGAVEMYGLSRSEAVGRISHELLRTVFPISLQEMERALLTDGRWDGELVHTRGDGRQIIVSSRHVMMRDQDGRPASVFEINRDVTAERRAREHLEALLDVTRSIISGVDAAAVFEMILHRARAIVGCALAAMVTREGDSLAVRAASGHSAQWLMGRRFGPAGSLTARALETGEPLFVPDLSTATGVAEEAIDGLGPALFMPLSAAGAAVGCILVANPAGTPGFSDDELKVLRDLFGATAAIAVEYSNAQATLRQVARLEDRERIARDLHDGAIQTLFAVGMSLQGTALMARDAGVGERLELNVAQLDEVIRNLRSYIFDLRPASRDDEVGIVLDRLVSEFRAQTGLATRLEVDSVAAGALRLRAHDIHQLTHEALSNIRKHSGATSCRVELRLDGDHAVLIIADDGKGIRAGRRPQGQGLRNINERSSLLGGSVSIESAPGAGTVVRITVPI